MKLKKALKLINEICLANTNIDGMCALSCPLLRFNCFPVPCCLHNPELKDPDFDGLSKKIKRWASERKQKRQEMLEHRLGHIRAH